MFPLTIGDLLANAIKHGKDMTTEERLELNELYSARSELHLAKATLNEAKARLVIDPDNQDLQEYVKTLESAVEGAEVTVAQRSEPVFRSAVGMDRLDEYKQELQENLGMVATAVSMTAMKLSDKVDLKRLMEAVDISQSQTDRLTSMVQKASLKFGVSKKDSEEPKE